MARNPPSQPGQRASQNLSKQIRAAQLTHPLPSTSTNNVLASLRATSIITSKPALPAELIATILDYVAVPDLLRFARVSRRLNEMVYDDTRWIAKLQLIGVWNESEARQRAEEQLLRRREAERARAVEEARRNGSGVVDPVGGTVTGGRQMGGARGEMLFDAGVEEARFRRQGDGVVKRRQTLEDGFDDMTVSSPKTPGGAAARQQHDPSYALNCLKQAKSIRGRARQEFSKIYSALGPLYTNLTTSSNQSNALIFQTYRSPEQQAQILSNLRHFAQSDTSSGWASRAQKLESVIAVFESAVLGEFKRGYLAEPQDIDGRMRRYAHVLAVLNNGGTAAAVESFISLHPLMSREVRAGNPLDCLEAVAQGHVDLNPSQRFFEGLARIMVEQAGIVDRVFPRDVDVLTPFLSRLCEEIVAEYLTALFDEAHLRGAETYVKAVSGTFEQGLRFVASLKPTRASPNDFRDAAKRTVCACWERHMDLYLAEELAVFREKSQAEVAHWEKEQQDQEASSEAFFMTNFSRQAAKRDFLGAFRKVVMMPVNVLPGFPLSSPFASSAKTSAAVAGAGGKEGFAAERLAGVDTSYARPPRAGTPDLSRVGTPNRMSTPAPPIEPPTTELAAKAAIMNSRLEGIRSLFSIEVALNLTHYAKASIERAANMVRMDGGQGEEARRCCEEIFVALGKFLVGARRQGWS